jgi:hypothetical protein
VSQLTTTIYPDCADPQWAHGDHVYVSIHVVADNRLTGETDRIGWVLRDDVNRLSGSWASWVKRLLLVFDLPPNAWF